MSQHAGVYSGIPYAPPELQSGAGGGSDRFWRAEKGFPGAPTIIEESSKPGKHKKPHQEPPAHHTVMRVSVRPYREDLVRLIVESPSPANGYKDRLSLLKLQRKVENDDIQVVKLDSPAERPSAFGLNCCKVCNSCLRTKSPFAEDVFDVLGYPSLWNPGFDREGRTADQHDAYSVAAWMRQADREGNLQHSSASELV
jgi:hypothetical protein